MTPLAPARCFTAAHLERHRKAAPAPLAEQAVRCLELVCELAREKIDFLFKGGNSLLLILDTPRRFSIDVDISTDLTRDRLDAAVDAAVARYGVFKKVERRAHKTKPWLPMTSYNIYYDSALPGVGETFIMLDAMLKKSTYPTQRKKAVCGRLFESNVIVELPEPSSIVSDKLLTLGPNTLGIPLGKNKEAQRLKHVHDVALLLEKGNDLATMRKSLKSCMAQELEIQARPLTLEAVLEDTIRFLALSTTFTEEPSPEGLEPALREIVVGRQPFEEHLFVRDFPWKRLQLDMAKCGLAITAAVRETVGQKDFDDALKLTDPGLIWKQATLWSKG